MVPAPALPVCPSCGVELPNNALAMACGNCLNLRYLNTLLDQESEAWSKVRFLDVGISRERGRAVHATLKVDPDFTYCGQPATEAKKRRTGAKLDRPLPDGLCPACLRNFEQVQRRAAEIERAKGVQR